MGMMMEDEMMEMVDDNQIENVGIMSGFMDDIEELMAEISEEEMNGMEEGDEAGTNGQTAHGAESSIHSRAVPGISKVLEDRCRRRAVLDAVDDHTRLRQEGGCHAPGIEIARRGAERRQ